MTTSIPLHGNGRIIPYEQIFGNRFRQIFRGGNRLQYRKRRQRIPALKKDVMGAGMAIRVGPMLEYSRFYVPFEHLEAAKAIVDDLFSDARGEITEQ